MPVLSPKPAVHDPLIAAHPSKKREISVVGAPQEESITNVKPEKLANMKMMMKTYVFSALKEKEVGNDERYNQLVSLLTTDPTQPDAPSPLKVYVWMMVLSQSVSQLDKSCATLVEAVLRIDWSVQEEPFASTYIEFLENLVSAHAFYVTPIMRCIARNFQFRQRLPPYAKVKRTVAYRRNHEALRSILRLIPTSTNTLFQSLNRALPHHTLNTAAQATYIKNILEILDYVPFLRRQILQLVITHMVTIDAHIQIELDELDDEVDFDTYNMDFDKDYESGDESEENDDDDGSSVGTDIEEDYDEKEFAKKMASGREKQVRYIQSMVRKLDSMMCLALGYLARFAVKSSAEDRIDVFHILISAFDHSIVKTLKSRYTQFLLFYFCSLDPELFPEHFINHLMEHIADTSRPGITRVACAAYMSSYVARAKSLDPAAIQRAVGLLSSWCMDYVEQYETSTVQPDAGKYDIFYAAMQAIMYIFCFRWRELVVNDDLEAAVSEDTPRPTGQPDADGMPIVAFDGSSISRNWCSGLRNMPRLVTSRFNPLKVCAPMVVKQFARISHDSNFMYVYPILERNKHVFVPGISDGPLSKEQSILLTVQTFFPFDPYKLNSSKSFIDNIYFEWQADDDEESDEESDEEDEDDEEGDEDVTAGITAMSISPSPNHFMPVP